MRTNITKTANQPKPILKILSILAILVQTIALNACGKDGDSGETDTSSSSVETVHYSSSSGGGNSSSNGASSSSSGVVQSSSGEIERGSVSYDGKSYETVKIGEQWWMAENLAIEIPGGSECYPEPPCLGEHPCAPLNYCLNYGRLYDWETAMGICPDGWHLPSKAEWEELIDFANHTLPPSPAYITQAGGHLKAVNTWSIMDLGEIPGGVFVGGLDTYGFRALPGGLHSNTYGTEDREMGFYDIGEGGYWWTSTPDIEEVTAHNTRMRHNSGEVSFGSANMPSSPKSDLMSVRCVGDNVQPRTQE